MNDNRHGSFFRISSTLSSLSNRGHFFAGAFDWASAMVSIGQQWRRSRSHNSPDPSVTAVL
jgi:hypothetical protein